MIQKPDKKLYCCGTLAEWVIQTQNLAYFYCKSCKNEVTESKPKITPNNGNSSDDGRHYFMSHDHKCKFCGMTWASFYHNGKPLDCKPLQPGYIRVPVVYSRPVLAPRQGYSSPSFSSGAASVAPAIHSWNQTTQLCDQCCVDVGNCNVGAGSWYST